MIKYMQYFCIILIGLSCSSVAPGDPRRISKVESGWDNYNLKGKVRTLNEIHHELSGDVIDSVKRDGIVYEKLIEFDGNGRTTEIKELKGQKLTNRKIHFYDTLGNLAKVEFYEGTHGTPSSKLVFKYDKLGNIEEDIQYNYDDSFNSKTIYSNNFELSTIEYKRVDINGKLISKEIKKYDERGQEVEYEAYDSNEKLSSVHKYEYNGDGNMINDFYDFVEIGSKIEYKYKYDDRGNVTEQTDLSDENEVIELEYKTFDQLNNWTKTIVIRKGKPFQIIQREYVYY